MPMADEPAAVVTVPRGYAYQGETAVIVPDSERGDGYSGRTVVLEVVAGRKQVVVNVGDLPGGWSGPAVDRGL